MTQPAVAAATRPPFWSDDFDADLLKVVPGVEQVLGASADIVLYTHGETKDGRLLAPNQWNGYQGTLAFFGFEDAARPAGYVASSALVECTFLEAVRDAWVHGYRLYVQGHLVWDAWVLRHTMMLLMEHARGWSHLNDVVHAELVRKVTRSLEEARARLQVQQARHGGAR